MLAWIFSRLFPAQALVLERELREEGASLFACEKEIFLQALLLALAFGFAVGWLWGWLAGVLLFVPATGISALLLFGLRLVEQERKHKILEERIPDLLLQLSLFPAGTQLEEMLGVLARSEKGEARRVLEKVVQRMEAGADPASVLEQERQQAQGKNARLFAELLLLELESGYHQPGLLKETAENLLEQAAIRREWKASYSLQRYTLLLGAVFLIPASLGFLFHFVQGLELEGLEELNIGNPAEEREGWMQALQWAVPIYLAELCLLVSWLLAAQEGARKKAIVYALLLLPAGLLSYALSAGQIPLLP